MVSSLKDLATQYSQQYGAGISSKEKLRQLYSHYVKERETGLLDAVAATAALDALVLSDEVNINAINPQMRQAFELAFPRIDIYERLRELDGLTPDARQATGFLNNWRGKYFEVVVRDKLNAGESVGGIQLDVGQRATLAENVTQPGWDLKILNEDGSTDELLQLKATSSLSYVKGAIEKYPDFQVITTEEAANQIADDLVLNSDISNAELNSTIRAPADDLLDTPFEEFIESVLPALPFVLIATTEGTKWLIGRQPLQQAVNRSLERSTKTGASIGVGAVLSLVGAGFISLPATFATRMGIDRYRIYSGLSKRLRADTNSIRILSKV